MSDLKILGPSEITLKLLTSLIFFLSSSLKPPSGPTRIAHLFDLFVFFRASNCFLGLLQDSSSQNIKVRSEFTLFQLSIISLRFSTSFTFGIKVKPHCSAASIALD